MIVVSNTTPLIGLASIGRFELLRQIFREIYIPKAVYDEAVVFGHEKGGAKKEVSAATWIKVKEVQDRLAVEVLLDELDMGEAKPLSWRESFRPSGCSWMKRKGAANWSNWECRKLAPSASC